MNTDIIGKPNQLYLDIKICLHCFPGGLKDTGFGKSTRFTFCVPVPKVIEVMS